MIYVLVLSAEWAAGELDETIDYLNQRAKYGNPDRIVNGDSKFEILRAWREGEDLCVHIGEEPV